MTSGLFDQFFNIGIVHVRKERRSSGLGLAAGDPRRRSQVVKVGVCKTPITGLNPVLASTSPTTRTQAAAKLDRLMGW